MEIGEETADVIEAVLETGVTGVIGAGRVIGIAIAGVASSCRAVATKISSGTRTRAARAVETKTCAVAIRSMAGGTVVSVTRRGDTLEVEKLRENVLLRLNRMQMLPLEPDYMQRQVATKAGRSPPQQS